MAANIATIQALLSFLNGTTGAAANIQLALTSFAVAGNHFVNDVFNVPTTAGGTAIPKGGVGNGGFFIFLNTDPTNYVQILNAVGGTVLLRIGPGEPAMGRFDPTVTAPAAVANSGAVDLAYLFLDA